MSIHVKSKYICSYTLKYLLIFIKKNIELSEIDFPLQARLTLVNLSVNYYKYYCWKIWIVYNIELAHHQFSVWQKGIKSHGW